jgi:hypothetical protein
LRLAPWREKVFVKIGRDEMIKTIELFTFALLFVFGSATPAAAQVKRIQMHIAGYLCGN